MEGIFVSKKIFGLIEGKDRFLQKKFQKIGGVGMTLADI